MLLLAACTEDGMKKGHSINIPKNLLQEGDLVFRRGTGVASRIVLAADRKGTYSHVGILKKEEGEWYVIHAVPGEPDFEGEPDKVKMEPVDSFFTSPKAICGAVMRVNVDTLVCRKAAMRAEKFHKANTLFDHQYNLKDSTEMYCTELIDYVFKKEGIDLIEGRISKLNLPAFKGEYILPSDVTQSEKLCLIYYF